VNSKRHERSAVVLEVLLRDAAAAIEIYMQVHSISEEVLAARLKIRVARLRRFLQPSADITLGDLACIFAALGATPQIRLVPDRR
jgi:hypothetical protein